MPRARIYGDADPALTYTYTPSLIGSDTFSGALSRAAGEDVGTYAITQGTLALSGNYTITYVGANLTISPLAITVTADAQGKDYGDADPALTYTYTPSLVGSDTFSGALSRAAGENVGTYAITQGTLALSGNYTITYVGANLTISPLAITVTADAQGKDYGDADPALTYTYTPSLIGSDTFSGALSRAAGENVGTYAITQGTLALSGNYTITYVGANLTISPLAITVTADAQGKDYGDADPALTYTYTPSLIGSDSFSGALSRAAGEDVGTYAITQGTLALSGNYTITYVGANLTISPLAITVTADAQGKDYGDADPALTYTYTPSLVGSDTFSGALSRAAGENVGTYAITQGTLALSSNYTITYVGANLTIIAAGHNGHRRRPGQGLRRRRPGPDLYLHAVAGRQRHLQRRIEQSRRRERRHLRHNPGHPGPVQQLHHHLRRGQPDHLAPGHHRDGRRQDQDLRGPGPGPDLHLHPVTRRQRHLQRVSLPRGR